jgi:hypothetical protein
MSPHPPGFHSSWFRINFSAAVLEFFSLLPQSVLDRAAFINCVLFRVAPHVFCYLHAAEVRAAHAAKVRGFGTFAGKGFIVEFARGLGIEREIELVFPAKFEACLTNGVVAVLRAGPSLECTLIVHRRGR